MEAIPATTYKYKELIDSLGLTVGCPDGDCAPIDSTAFRLERDPHNDGMSFLPNIPYDAKRGRPRRVNAKDNKRNCGLCGLSFFFELQSAQGFINAFGAQKIREVMEYTAIAEGTISPTDGVAAPANDHGHFVFFEYQGVDLTNRFTIISPI